MPSRQYEIYPGCMVTVEKGWLVESIAMQGYEFKVLNHLLKKLLIGLRGAVVFGIVGLYER